MSPNRAAPWLRPVEAALDAAPAPVEVFFRDDDAGWGRERLLELLDLFVSHDAPLDLAVIPIALEADLAAELLVRAASSGAKLGLHQHGYGHVNHETVGRKCEFGPARDRLRQEEDIASGRVRLAVLLGDAVDPIFTPPWNRCTSDTGRCLADLGFVALSREARAAPLGIEGLQELPVNVDWLAHRHKVRVSIEELGARLGDAIEVRRPVGVMLHHALMDATDMRRAGELLNVVVAHPHARPRRMAELIRTSGVV